MKSSRPGRWFRRHSKTFGRCKVIAMLYNNLQTFCKQTLREVPRYVPIAAGYCRTGGGGEGAFMASVTTRFLHDAAGRIKEVPSRP